MSPSAVESLFGLPLAIDRSEAVRLRNELAALIEASAGSVSSPIKGLPKPLLQLFSPKSRESTLRKALSNVGEVHRADWSIFLRPPLVKDAGPGRRIPTIEGLAVWDALATKLQHSTELVTFSAAEVAGIASWVSEQYRLLSLERFNTVVRYLQGEGPPMGLPAVGMLLLLLINRNDHPDRRLDRTGRENIDKLISSPIERFANSIKEGRRDPRHFSLYSGYSLTEATRRLGEWTLHQDSNWVYIDPEYRDQVVGVIGRELARRPALDEERLKEAVDHMVTSYRQVAGDLARLGSAHEDAGATQRTITQLVRAFQQARENE